MLAAEVEPVGRLLGQALVALVALAAVVQERRVL
jgi:hypothetical protein